MDDKAETTILEEGNVRIASRRAIIGSRTYDLSDIASVTVEEKKLSRAAGRALMITLIVLPIIGLLLSSWATIVDHWSRSYIECLFGFLWALLFSSLITGRATFMVQIETAVGKSNILESKDKDFIQRIVDAMNDAITRRG